MIPTYLPVLSGLVKHTAEALKSTKLYVPSHTGFFVTSWELPAKEFQVYRKHRRISRTCR